MNQRRGPTRERQATDGEHADGSLPGRVRPAINFHTLRADSLAEQELAKVTEQERDSQRKLRGRAISQTSADRDTVMSDGLSNPVILSGVLPNCAEDPLVLAPTSISKR